MRVMVIVKATKESEAEDNPFEVEGAAEMFEAMGKYNEELVKAGIMLAGDGLKPSKFGKRVHFNGTKRSVTDGPFAETKELVAGFWIWQVRSMDEAIEWAKRCPTRCRVRRTSRSVRSGSRRTSVPRSPPRRTSSAPRSPRGRSEPRRVLFLTFDAGLAAK